MKIKLFTLVLSVLIIFSCKKENTTAANPSPTIPINTYFPLSIGNYWVYEFSTHLPDGSIVGTPSIDTLKVVRDTLISDNTYYIIETNKPIPNSQHYRRDSIGFIINNKGIVTLPPSANEGLYNFHYGFINGSDTAYAYWEEFQDGYSISNSTGTYDCMAQLATHEAWPIIGGNTVVDTSYYSTIGIVQRSFSYLSGAKNIGVLMDYHLEE